MAIRRLTKEDKQFLKDFGKGSPAVKRKMRRQAISNITKGLSAETKAQIKRRATLRKAVGGKKGGGGGQ